MLTGIRMQRGGLLRFVPLAGAPWSRLPLPEELEPLTVPADQGYGAGAGETVLTVQKIEGFGNDAYPPFSSWSGDGKRIIYSYSKMADQPGVITVLDLTTSRFNVFERFPNLLTYEIRWRPNDRWLMIVHSPKAADSGPSQISAAPVLDGKLRPITRDTNSYSTLTLSADGRTAVTVQAKRTEFLDLLPGQDLSPKWASMPASKTIENVSWFDWATDGKLIVSDGSKLSRIAADGVKETELTADSSAAVVGLSQCSNGYVLVNWEYHAGNQGSAIWRINSDGSNPTQLSNGKHDISSTCSPDGKWAYYLDGLLSLKRVPVEGGDPEIVPGRSIPNLDRFMGTVSFSPDGEHLVVLVDIVNSASNREKPKLAIMDLQPASSSTSQLLDPDPRIVAGSLHSGGARFSPDGKSLVYAIHDRGVENLWMQPLDGSPAHQITNFSSDQIEQFRWSAHHGLFGAKSIDVF